MAEEAKTIAEPVNGQLLTSVAPGPHVSSTTLTTRRMMLDVLIGLVPVMAVAAMTLMV